MLDKIMRAAVGALTFGLAGWILIMLGVLDPTEWSDTRFLVFVTLLIFGARVIGIVIDDA